MNRKIVNIVIVGVILLISGCNSGNIRNTINSSVKIPLGPPKPYEMAMQELKSQNLDKSLRYLDLVIKDFPNNKEYVYRAHFLKTIIYTDYYTANINITDALLEGVKDNPFSKPDETQQILDSTQTILDEINTFKKPFLESAIYVYEHYDEYKNVDFPLHYSHNDNSTEALNAVDWFRKCGTPMPSDDQVNSALCDARVYYLGSSLDELIKNNKINYPAYFYATGGVANEWDKDFAKKLVQKIIEITEDDKYNKYRIDAEDVLKNSFNNNK